MIIGQRKTFIMFEIRVENLSKKYGKKIIFSNLNISISNEKINLLVGSNGIGKTTFIKCLKQLVKYDGYINNEEYEIAYSPDKVNYPDFISVYNFLYLLSSTNQIARYKIKNLLTEKLKGFNIYSYRNTPIIKLSKGTKQKISLIQALIQEKEVYIFDEPLNGIDEETKNVFIKEIIELVKKEKLVLIITHQSDSFPLKNVNIIDFNKYGKIY